MKINEVVQHTLPIVKADILRRLETPSLDPVQREELLNQFGLLDDMQVDDEGNLTIYREISVSLVWIKNASPKHTKIGTYWSHQIGTAHPYNAAVTNEKRDFRIQALVASSFTDWDSIWEKHGVGENEVELQPGTPVRVERVWVNGVEEALPNWVGHVYSA